MVRSARAVFAALVIPGLLAAQQTPRSHTVRPGDTLWDLANQYYSNPFDWRRIWTANQASVTNPNLILPGQVLTIPDVMVDATVTGVLVERGPAAPLPPVRTGPPRTIFYNPVVPQVTGGSAADPNVLAVSRDQVYSAPWLIPLETVPEHWGVVASFATGSGRSETPRSFDRVVIRPRGATLRVGDELRTFRVARTVKDVGDVVRPTGVITITDVGSHGVVGVVTKEYDRISLTDMVGPLPNYPIQAGRMAEAVTRGSAAMVMGFAGLSVLQDLGAIAFLDLGLNGGVAVGDEFVYRNPAAGDSVIEGRLQVVGVTAETASAQIIDIDDAVFQQGVVVHLTRKMR